MTLDETTWPNSSYANVQGRVRGGKTGKGGEHVIVTDARRQYIYQYTARHSFHKKEEPYTQQGPAEVKRILDDLAPLVQGNPKPATDKRRQIFTELPHITMDNHFSGDHIIKLIGERGGSGC